jgi:hypothetical protein
MGLITRYYSLFAPGSIFGPAIRRTNETGCRTISSPDISMGNIGYAIRRHGSRPKSLHGNLSLERLNKAHRAFEQFQTYVRRHFKGADYAFVLATYAHSITTMGEDSFIESLIAKFPNSGSIMERIDCPKKFHGTAEDMFANMFLEVVAPGNWSENNDRYVSSPFVRTLVTVAA